MYAFREVNHLEVCRERTHHFSRLLGTQPPQCRGEFGCSLGRPFASPNRCLPRGFYAVEQFVATLLTNNLAHHIPEDVYVLS